MQNIIDNTSVGGRFRQITQTIPALGIYTLQESYRSFRVLELSTSDTCEYRLGNNSSFVNLNVGIGISFPTILPSITIRNISNAPVTITFAIAIGDITDDRLNISGDVNVISLPLTMIETSLSIFPTNGIINVVANHFKRVLIQNMSINHPIYIFNSNTFKVLPSGTFDMPIGLDFNVYGIEDEVISIARFN